MPQKDPAIDATTRQSTRNSCHKMSKATYRIATVKLHVPWTAESSKRLYDACRTQDACWNLALDWLIKHPDEELRRSKVKGVKGLQGRWLEWRAKHPWAKETAQAIWRGGILRAHEQVQRWETVNAAHASALVKALEEGKTIPRRVQRRQPDPQRLYRCRKQRDCKRQNTLLVMEGLKRKSDRSLYIPGVKEIQVREKLLEDFKPRSCTVVERTTADRARRRKLKPEDRSFEIHVQVRVPVKRDKRKAHLAAVAADHGIVHAMTTYDSNGDVHFYHHRTELLDDLDREVRELQKSLRNCKRGARKSKKRLGMIAALRKRMSNIRSHDRRVWASEIAQTADVLAVEKMNVRNLVRSARGTQEEKGKTSVPNGCCHENLPTQLQVNKDEK